MKWVSCNQQSGIGNLSSGHGFPIADFKMTDFTTAIRIAAPAVYRPK